MSTATTTDLESANPPKKPVLTARNALLLAGGLVIGGTIIFGVVAYRNRGKEEAVPTGTKSGGGEVITPPIVVNTKENAPIRCGSLNDIKEDYFEKVQKGLVKLDDDVDNKQAQSLTNISNFEKLTPKLFKKLLDNYNPAVSEEIPEGVLTDDEELIFKALKQAHKETLKVAFFKGPATRVEPTKPPEVEEEQKAREAAEVAKNNQAVPSIDLSALKSDDTAIADAFTAITSGNFTVIAKTGNQPDADLKASLVDAITTKGLTQALFTKLVKGEATDATDETVLATLRGTSLEGTLNIKAAVVPARPFAELFTEYEMLFTAQCTTYESGAEPTQAEMDGFTNKLQALIESASKIDPDSVPDPTEKARVTAFKASPSADTLFNEVFTKKLETAIKACKVDVAYVEKVVAAMLKCCPAAFKGRFGPATTAASGIPDVILRTTVYADETTWPRKTVDLATTMANLVVFKIDEDVRNVLVALDKQALYKLYLEQPDETTLNAIIACIKRVGALKAEFSSYDGKTFGQQSESVTERIGLQDKLTLFTSECIAVATITELILPALNTKTSDHNAACNTSFQAFKAALDTYFDEPDPTNIPTLQALLDEAKNFCVSATSKPANISQSLAFFAQEKYTELSEDIVEIAPLTTFLAAVRAFDNTYLNGETVESLLCAKYSTFLKNSMTAKNIVDAKNYYNIGKPLCLHASSAHVSTKHVSFNSNSLEEFVESDIQQDLDRLLAGPNPIADVDIDSLFSKMTSVLTPLKNLNKFLRFTDSNVLKRYLLFKQGFAKFKAAQTAFISVANPLDSPNLEAFKTAIKEVRKFYNLDGPFVAQLDDADKSAYESLGQFSLPKKSEEAAKRYLFNVWNAEFANLILAYVANRDKTDIQNLFRKIYVSFQSWFLSEYPGVTNLDPPNTHIHFYSLKVRVVYNALANNKPLTEPMKEALVVALNCADNLTQVADILENDAKASLLTVIDQDNLLKAYFTEKDISTRDRIKQLVITAATFLTDCADYSSTSPRRSQANANAMFEYLKSTKQSLDTLFENLSDKVGDNPFTLPERLKLPIEAPCAAPHEKFVKAFEKFLDDSKKPKLKTAAIDAFTAASTHCRTLENYQQLPGTEMQLDNIYSSNFDTFIYNYYKALLESALNTEDLEGLLLEKLTLLSDHVPVNQKFGHIFDRWFSYFQDALKKYSVNFALLAKNAKNWEIILGKDIKKQIRQAIVESRKDMLYDKDTMLFYQYTEDLYNFAQSSLTIVKLADAENAYIVLGQIFECAGQDFINDFANLLAKGTIFQVIQRFKESSALYAESTTLCELNCWRKTAEAWIPSSTQEMFFYELLINFWNTANVEIYKKLDLMYPAVQKKFPRLVSLLPGTVETKFVDTIKKKLVVDEATFQKLKTAIYSFQRLNYVRDHLDCWADCIDIGSFPLKFYQDVLNVQPVALDSCTKFFNEDNRPRVLLKPVLSITYLDAAITVVDEMKNPEDEFNQVYEKFKARLTAFFDNPTAESKVLLERAYNFATKLLSLTPTIPKPPEFQKGSLFQELQDQYNGALKNVLGLEMTDDRINGIQKKLEAMRVFNPNFKLNEDVRLHLCQTHTATLDSIFEESAEEYSATANVIWTNSQKICPVGFTHAVMNSDSLSDYLEFLIENNIQTAVNYVRFPSRSPSLLQGLDRDLLVVLNQLLLRLKFMKVVNRNHNYSKFSADINCAMKLVYLKKYTELLNLVNTIIQSKISITYSFLWHFKQFTLDLKSTYGDISADLGNSNNCWFVAMEKWIPEANETNSTRNFYRILIIKFNLSLDSETKWGEKLFKLLKYLLVIDPDTLIQWNDSIGNYFVEVLKKHRQLEVGEINGLKQFIGNHKDFQQYRPHHQIWVTMKFANMTPAFYVEFLCAKLTDLQSFTNRLNNPTLVMAEPLLSSYPELVKALA